VVRGLGNHKIVKMLTSLLKLHKPLLIFLVEPMMSYTDSFNVLFKSVNMHSMATSPIVNKAAKLWYKTSENSTMQSQYLDYNTHTKVVILNSSRTHTTFGKHNTEFRTPSESAHQ